jgi:hypothetical protein
LTFSFFVQPTGDEATNLPLFSRPLQLRIPLRMDLMLTVGEHSSGVI